MKHLVRQLAKAEDLKNVNGLSPRQTFIRLKTRESGLKNAEVIHRRLVFGYNETNKKDRYKLLKSFFSKLASPLVIALIIVAGVSWYFGQTINAIIVLAMALIGVVLSFIQEYKAQNNAEKLQAMVHVKCHVWRQGKIRDISLREVVPGDIIELSAGDMVPADVKLISEKDLFINQSALNGESFPIEKQAETKNRETASVFDLDTIICMGSSVVSGIAKGVVVNTGLHTQFGQLSEKITTAETETAFDLGIRKFTWLMIKLILSLATFIFLVNTFLKGDFVDSLLFSLAVAVGLTPEMLPMIVTVNLSRGALKMAKKMVIIKRLDSIQDFGAMDILCTDKTGTLTMDQIVLIKHCDISGNENEDILKDAYLNSSNQSGLNNLLDKAIIEHHDFKLKDVKKIDEIPFDFSRKMMSVVVRTDGHIKMISKGAPEEIFKKCTSYELKGKLYKLTSEKSKLLQKKYDELSKDGFRVLGLAYKEIIKKQKSYSQKDECELVFRGFAAFLDPPKQTSNEAISNLESLGIKLKILSGDNEFVTEKICQEVGLIDQGLLTGIQIDALDDEQLKQAVEKTVVFARMAPMQKERVINALRKNGHIVGFLGDGINDAPALKAADVGISVDNAVDIAKETADIILLKKNLLVLGDCVKEGRKTFANTLKYIKMGASSNFGNMLSMTGASVFLPFLPMLPTQILLNNFLYDISQVAIPADNVDEDYVLKPRPWNIKFIKEFILILGPISSIFDFLTFGVMYFVFSASPELFRTGWFVESLFTQTLIIYIIRTEKIPFLESWPSKSLFALTLGVVGLGCLLPFSPLGKWFQFVPLPPLFFLILFGIGVTYLLLTQFIKKIFIKKFGYQ